VIRGLMVSVRGQQMLVRYCLCTFVRHVLRAGTELCVSSAVLRARQTRRDISCVSHLQEVSSHCSRDH